MYRSYINKIIIIVFHSLFMLVLTYVLINFPYLTEEENDFLEKVVVLNTKYLIGEHQDKEDEVIFINTGYDRMLTDKFTTIETETGKIKLKEGNIDITDRKKLYDFFKILNKKNLHKYLIVDIGFYKDYVTKYDSVLLNEMLRTKKMILALPSNENDINPLFRDNFETGKVNYPKNLLSNHFSKFVFLRRNNKKSLPLKLYEQIDNKKIEKKLGLFYYSNGQLCYNSGIININYRVSESYRNHKTGKNNYYNLGTDLLVDSINAKYNPTYLTESLVKDKVVILGDLTTSDIHETFWEKISGPEILYNSYLYLKKGEHIVNKWMYFILFWLYLILNYSIVFNKKLLHFKSKNMFAKIFSHHLFSTSVFFLLLTIIFYYLYGIYISILSLILYVSIFRLVINYKFYRNEN